MSIVECAGVRLGVERAGEGQALLLVHGAWSDRSTWDPVFSLLAARFRAIRYDRRGYGESQWPGCGVAGHTADLLSLVQAIGLDQVTLVGNSFGGVIAILAALHAPDLVARVIVHEPPLLEVLDLVPEHRALGAKVRAAVQETYRAARGGNHRLAAQLYVEGVASYPGAWQYLPEPMQLEFVRHVAAFISEMDGAGERHVSLERLQAVANRLIITRGGRSSPYLRIIVDQLAASLPAAQRHVFASTGHVPHQSSPADFVAFISQVMAEASPRFAPQELQGSVPARPSEARPR